VSSAEGLTLDGIEPPTPAAPPRLRRIDAEVETLRARNDDDDNWAPSPERIVPRYDSFSRMSARTFTGAPAMGIFSRTRDIIAANFNDLLEKAEDPSKMIRLMILEMEETLVEVRSASARTIADQKELRRHVARLERLQADWADKAQLALSKDREDLARAALMEKKKAAEMSEQLRGEIAVLDDALTANEGDIEKLQLRLREARSRQSSILTRLQSAEHRVKLRTLLTSDRVDDAMNRFDQLERRVDYAEGRADALSMGMERTAATPSLAEQIAALEDGDKVDAELEAMKRALGKDAQA
jgi:phage shock protein A